MLRVATLPLLLLLLLPTNGIAAQQQPCTVATHYFYWYHWPTEHFAEPGAPGREGHCRHFLAPETVSYRSVDWHERNFRDMAAANIDVALPVYWGAPGAYERPGLAFSRVGLSPMVAALDRLAAAGTATPKLGLFYDTSTLANDVRGAKPRGGKTDLTSSDGLDLFCTTILDYFAAVPKQHWARHRGGALVVLYVSGFASNWNEHVGDILRERFAQRFDGDKVCLVADESWGQLGQDLTTAWGAALWGPKVHDQVVQIGPGYDDRPVPGRHTPVREREQGAFYDYSWQHALQAKPELVLLETWNEMHEGTEICPTREAGREYLERTRDWIAKLRRGDAPGAAVALRWQDPRPLADRSWGQDAAERDEVFADFGSGERVGLREVACEDGPSRVVNGVLLAGGGDTASGDYLYFQVSDHFAFDLEFGATFELEVRRRAGDRIALEFDSNDRTATLAGAYTYRRAATERSEGDAVVATYVLDGARFANRENGGADLRVVLLDRRCAIERVTLRRR